MTVLRASGLRLENRLLATDLTIDRPSLVCLIGPNGSGKTSLLHALAGIGSPEGRVEIDGRAPPQASSARSRLLAYLPASRDVPWPLAARAMVALSGATSAECGEALRELELESWAERRVDRLSTGERSRVLIARALAPRPRLLLLDEPTANLDPLWQLKLMEKLAARAHSGEAALIVAMHDLDLAGRFAGRLVLMAEGRVVADGPPSEVIEGDELRRAFGIERRGGLWRPVSRPEDRRSSP